MLQGSRRIGTVGRYIAASVIWLALAIANGATLKPETISAWDSYMATADANLQDRVRRGGKFLWSFEDAQRAGRVRAGELVVAAAPGQEPKKVPGGLIHHWIGAMFLSNATVEHVLRVTRDYDRYGEFYRPSVIGAKAMGSDGD